MFGRSRKDRRGIENAHADDQSAEEVITDVLASDPAQLQSMAVQLAGGFYTPDEGRISLLDASCNPINYSTLTPDALRGAVTCVFDEAFLYSTSVFDNIALGAHRELSGTALASAVHEAARLACADEFITALPDGYDTAVGLSLIHI